MPRAKFLRASLLSLLAVGLWIACFQIISSPQPISQSLTTTQPNRPESLLVAAAASLQPALQEISLLYAQANPDQIINYTFASSGALQRQIEQGAPIDIFISAASQPIYALNENDFLLSDSIQDLLTNQMVLITPKNASIVISSFEQLVQPNVRRISIGEPRSVPAGQYASEVLENLGILAQVQPKLVLGNNVRSVLSGVESGDVDAGIVYITDARSSDKVVIAAIAEKRLHSPVRYLVAILKSSRLTDKAQQYIKFLKSSEVSLLFEKHGFDIVEF